MLTKCNFGARRGGGITSGAQGDPDRFENLGSIPAGSENPVSDGELGRVGGVLFHVCAGAGATGAPFHFPPYPLQESAGASPWRILNLTGLFTTANPLIKNSLIKSLKISIGGKSIFLNACALRVYPWEPRESRIAQLKLLKMTRIDL